MPQLTAVNKPANTLVDRPAHRDWTIWFAVVFLAVAHLGDVIEIYLLDRQIYRVLGPRGIAMTLVAELLLASMTATFVVVVLTTSRRALRSWRYQRYLRQNVTILTSPARDGREMRPQAPSSAPIPLTSAGEPDGIREGVPSLRRRTALVRLRFDGDEGAASTGSEGSPHGRG